MNFEPWGLREAAGETDVRAREEKGGVLPSTMATGQKNEDDTEDG